LRIKLGAHVDYSAGFDAGLRVSPDALIQYTFADSYIVYAQAGGGFRANDFRRQTALNPYVYSLIPPLYEVYEAPRATQLRNAYERLNASIGFRASPANGLWLNLYGGYQRRKDDVATDGLWRFYNMDPANFYGGAEVRYAYKNIFALRANAIYRSWSVKDVPYPVVSPPWYNDIPMPALRYTNMLAMKPVVEGDIRVEARPISPLQVHVGLTYVERKRYAVEGVSTRKAPVSNLYLGADYTLLSFATLYVRVDNVLNRKYEIYDNIYAQRFNFLGGLRFRF
jgi:hypothetical protein